MATTDMKVILTGTKQIELPQLNLEEYIGNKIKIEKVEEYKGDFGYYIKVQTEIVATLTEGRKEALELRASRIFSLQEDEDGVRGWGAKTKLGLFLKKMNLEHYSDLVGATVIVQTTTNKERTFLSFS